MDYLNEKITYTNDGRLIDSTGRSIMMDWEYDIMYHSAKTICKNGGDVLNIGFGMGIIDGLIETHDINQHYIIEAHPDVHQHMKDKGWYDKSNVHIIESKWQDVISKLPKFDGIYFDTWRDTSFHKLFVPNLNKIMKIGGVFSYWGHHPNIGQIRKEFERFGFETTYFTIEIDNVPPSKEQFINGGYYWNEKYRTYNVLEIKKVREVNEVKFLF